MTTRVFFVPWILINLLRGHSSEHVQVCKGRLDDLYELIFFFFLFYIRTIFDRSKTREPSFLFTYVTETTDR